MKNIVGVRFKKPGKIYFFDPENLEINNKDFVIVETTQGQEFGEVVISNRKVEDSSLQKPLKKIIRIATAKDIKHNEENKKREKEAFEICNKKIKEHKLDMTLTDVEFKFDNSKVLFFFTADGRIDFRELVKDLATIFKTRIELRQIGGRELCCCSFLGNFETVSIKMAKEQNMSLNPSKISGNCGRLMCCLKYEQEVYEEKINRLPKVGAIVKTEDGEGTVEGVETLKEILRVKLKDDNGEYYYKKYNAKDVKIIKNIEKNTVDPEEKEHLKELQELEKLEKLDKKNATEEDI